ncbi:hypothetical protein [Streptomyces broussonetiae]|uniref:Uncharacterized protein n=1 Tax=Streptomyces broussonetiae TaxID=2686304 RepID=A0A6I6NMT7_9ACTN|nr:hypothetical protein [Streptomyces broussonetiae]QHA09267.1 hypothetical protein GQF42_44290 [Streptomyces broussonetiae]
MRPVEQTFVVRPEIPLVVFADPFAGEEPSGPGPRGAARGVVVETVAALEQAGTRAYSGPERVRSRLLAAAAAAGVIATALEADARLHGPGLARSSSEDYFRLRVAPLNPVAALAYGAGVIARAAGDLAWAPVVADDLALEVWALSYALAQLGERAGPLSMSCATSAPWAPAAPDVGGRWIIGHHARFLLEACAAARLAAAADWARGGQLEEAAGHVRGATVYVRGLPAAVAQACATPAARYHRAIRPGMAPPAAAETLSGSRHTTTGCGARRCAAFGTSRRR